MVLPDRDDLPPSPEWCHHCGGRLDRLDAHEERASETVHHHYRCHDRDCPATGGTVVRDPDGELVQRVGPAVDADHWNRFLESRVETVTTIPRVQGGDSRHAQAD